MRRQGVGYGPVDTLSGPNLELVLDCTGADIATNRWIEK